MSSEYTTDGAEPQDQHGRFFAVGADEFNAACDRGMAAASAYLVIACGTGRGQSRSRWSAQAVAKYTGMNPRTATAAIAGLEDLGLLVRHGTRARPQYELALGDRPIWLPNSIITAAADETPAIRRLRQVRDPEVLRLFVNLYEHQNLGFDGGISPDIIREEWPIDHVDSLGGFHACKSYDPRKLTTSKQNPYFGDQWWPRWNTLQRLGLVTKSVVLFDGPLTDTDEPGEMVFSVWGPSEEERGDMTFCRYLASRGINWLEDKLIEADGDISVAVPRYVSEPHVYGLYRMRHTARTRAASTWWARICEGHRDLRRMLGIPIDAPYLPSQQASDPMSGITPPY